MSSADSAEVLVDLEAFDVDSVSGEVSLGSSSVGIASFLNAASCPNVYGENGKYSVFHPVSELCYQDLVINVPRYKGLKNATSGPNSLRKQ